MTLFTILLTGGLADASQGVGIAADPPADAAPAPVRVTFRLADGVRVRGEMTQWDIDGLDGSFGPRRWVDLEIDDIWALRRRFMDQTSAQAWIDLARSIMLAALDQPDREARAANLVKQALRRARSRGECETLIAEAIAEVDAEKDLRRQEREAEEAMKLRTLSPEAAAWGSTTWPELTAEEQETAVLAIKADARRILERAGMQIAPVETDFFLFYSDMSRSESARWVRELDIMYGKLARRFGIDEKTNIFWGKAAIFVFSERDRFRLVEAESFNTLAPDWADGMCHPLGPRVFVSFYRQPRTELFAAVLVHETTHGFMHRYRTPRRLPTWANEGIADYMAATLFDRSTVDLERRQKGLRWIRSGGDVNSILSMRYGDGSWPGENEVGYSVGYLMVELMIRDRPREFAAWVEAIKSGKDWQVALGEDFGVPRHELVETFGRYYRVND